MRVTPRSAVLAACFTIATAAITSGQDATDRDPLDSFRARRGISRGLTFLAGTQKEDGSWETSRSHEPIYDTALAGLALLAEGSTTREGRFRGALEKAVQFVVSRIPDEGPIRVARPTGGDYEHYETWYAAMPALFLAEVYLEHKTGSLKTKLDALARRLVFLQRETGGWCHDLRSRMARSGTYVYAWYSEDLAIATSYAVVALKSLQRAGAPVPSKTLKKARDYLRRIHNEQGDGGFQYGLLHSWPRAVESEPGRTAAAIFALSWLGGEAKRLEVAARYLEKNFTDIPVSAGHANNVFSLNYLSGALACQRLGPAWWRKYAEHYVPRLVKLRRPGGAFELGRSHHDRPAMNTALALVILQLPKGHLSFAVPPASILARPTTPRRGPVVPRGIAYLLDHQEENGSWIADPSYLDPRGKLMVAPPKNIFTDDTMAVTALAARALLGHPKIEPERSRRAILRAVPFLVKTMDAERERYLTPECSPIWQAYLLDFLLDLKASRPPELAPVRKVAASLLPRVLDSVRAGECRGGGWTYTYYDSSRGTPRSFITALVVRSLLAARTAGIEVPAGLIERGAAWLDKAPVEGGGYRYLYYRPELTPRTTPMGSVGRMALIEKVRLDSGSGSVDALTRAVNTFGQHCALLDQAVHAQTRYYNEGCHHYFAYYHLSEAIAALPADRRPRWRDRVVKHLKERCRADGSWWDSKRAGPSAATALALLALAALEESDLTRKQ